MTPKVVIIQGAPASGKTTLANRLKEELPDLILLSKDTIKEFLFDTQPTGDREWSSVLGRASIRAMYVLAEEFLKAEKDVILECAFFTEYAVDDVKALGVPTLELYCHCDETIRQKRFKERRSTSRHPGHLDQETTSAGLLLYRPIKVGRVIDVDTTNGVPDDQLVQITNQVRDFLKEKTT